MKRLRDNVVCPKGHDTNILGRTKMPPNSCIACNRDYYSRTKRFRQYGITIEDYNRMFDHQKGRCAICKKHQSELNKRLHIDHNHDTGKVRGLLCSWCNAYVVTVIEKSGHLIEPAKEYLKGDLSHA